MQWRHQRDFLVNGADLSVMLGQFGSGVAPETGADLSVLLSRFGSSC